MTLTKFLLLATCVATFTGCNSKSSSTKTPVPPIPVVDRPLANYEFSDANLEETLGERLPFLRSMSVNFQETTYNEMISAEKLDENRVLYKLKSDNNNTLDLLLSNEEGVDCNVYRASEVLDGFECGQATRSTSGDLTLIQSTTKATESSVQVEFNEEFEEYYPTLGSTILTAAANNNKVIITTSFAFSDFFRDAFGLDGTGQRIHSTLGLTTFLQMRDIVSQHAGTEMTVVFNNNIGGSADDDINVFTGLMIHNNNMTTMVAPTGSVFSGGTDLFAAGNPRILQRATQVDAIETNKQIGVHSWGSDGKSAKEFPYTDESHRKQATFFNTVLGEQGIDFYLFTLDSAPADGEHWITKADSDKFGFITEIQ